MKIAVASEGNQVSMHFGHCEGFWVFEIEDSKIKNSYFLRNPGHRPGFLPEFLKERGVDCVISGGMGMSALELFESYGIDVITGAEGEVLEVIKKYVEGELKKEKGPCEEHGSHGHFH
ncbi:NifB/NifX family molybdenum-iron cluster-binding protein [Caldanaerobacter sp.]|uniref:NifB/NifX family molybdenum-iron cluster-binding protein n=1 Tax=Caldanaerobacter sp. TaxID=2930036 RepID=UPI003C73CCC4